MAGRGPEVARRDEHQFLRRVVGQPGRRGHKAGVGLPGWIRSCDEDTRASEMTGSTDLQPGSRPRVVHLLAPAPVGGAESVVRALASSRRRYSGHTEVVALVDDSGAEVFLQQLRASGVPTTAVREGRRRYFAQVERWLISSTGHVLI
jgi:hypothetical protein